MLQYEYHVLPAPRRGEKSRGARTTQERFAQTLTQVMNDLGRQGWEYLRADTLPCEERAGLTGKTTTWQHVLVFRRVLQASHGQPVAPEPGPRLSGVHSEAGKAPPLGPPPAAMPERSGPATAARPEPDGEPGSTAG